MVYAFGEFRLEASEMILYKGAEIVPLAPKAVLILCVLVEAGGKVVSKEEVFERVWVDTFVEESNLARHISSIRKMLGEDKSERRFIETVPRRGYRFIQPIAAPDDRAQEVVFSERILVTTRKETEIEIGDENLNEPKNETREIPNSELPAAAGKTKLLLAAGGSLIIILSVLLVYQFYKLRESATAAATLPQISFTRLFDNKSAGGTIISPDGKFAAYYQNHLNDGDGKIILRQIETNSEVYLFEPGKYVFGSMDFSPDGAQIFFVSFEQENKAGAIYSVPSLGGEPKKIVDLDDNIGTFALSPDGKRLAFFRRSQTPDQTRIVTAGVSEPAENEQTAVTLPARDFSPDEFIAWSPDGLFLTIPKSGGSDPNRSSALVQINLQNGEQTTLIADGFKWFGKMSYSRDGKYLYFVGQADTSTQKIYRLQLNTRRVERITNDLNNYGSYGLGLTADGKTLAVDFADIRSDLWSVPADGDATRGQLIKPGTSNGRRGLAAMPDGSVIYVARAGENFDLWIISPDGQISKQITNDAFEERMPTASHDGRYIVFVCNRGDGRQHLFRINADGSGLKQLTFGDTNDYQPNFSPDDRTIVYASAAPETERSIIKKILADGSSSGGGLPIQLTDYSAVDPNFSPDGKLIAVKLPSLTRNQPGSLAIIPADGGKPEKVFPVAEYEWLPYTIPLRWTPDGKALVFRQEKGGIGNLFLQKIDGTSAPVQLTNFTTDTFYNFVFTPDQKRILFARGLYQTNPSLIRNF